MTTPALDPMRAAIAAHRRGDHAHAPHVGSCPLCYTPPFDAPLADDPPSHAAVFHGEG